MNKRFKRLLLMLPLLPLLVLSAAAFAEEPSLQWQSLSPPQQQLLKRFESQWGAFSEDRKTRLIAGADSWLNATPEQREIMKQRFLEWI